MLQQDVNTMDDSNKDIKVLDDEELEKVTGGNGSAYANIDEFAGHIGYGSVNPKAESKVGLHGKARYADPR